MRERLVLASTEACHAGLRTEVSLLKEQARPYECGSAWISAVLVPCDAACLAEHPLDSGTEDLGDSGTEDRGDLQTEDLGDSGTEDRGDSFCLKPATACGILRVSQRPAATRAITATLFRDAGYVPYRRVSTKRRTRAHCRAGARILTTRRGKESS